MISALIFGSGTETKKSSADIVRNPGTKSVNFLGKSSQTSDVIKTALRQCRQIKRKTDIYVAQKQWSPSVKAITFFLQLDFIKRSEIKIGYLLVHQALPAKKEQEGISVEWQLPTYQQMYGLHTEQIWTCQGWGVPWDLWLTNGITSDGHVGTLQQKDTQTRLKTLPSRNVIGGR